MNHRDLLIKYIEYVTESEGRDYITSCDQRGFADVEFSDDEWLELETLAQLKYES